LFSFTVISLNKHIFQLFKKKSVIDKLQGEYKKCLKEAFILSKTNRKESDLKTHEANMLLNKIEEVNIYLLFRTAYL
tara:strand:+ start:7333 stop:7563 length:231 start_codon:yes stop_codon:yes gene_type:complete